MNTVDASRRYIAAVCSMSSFGVCIACVLSHLRDGTLNGVMLVKNKLDKMRDTVPAFYASMAR